MAFKYFYSPIIILLSLCFFLQSCEKKPITPLSQKSKLAAIDRFIDLGDIQYENANYDSAYYYHNKAKNLCNVKTDNTRIIYSLSRMAEIQQNQGDFAGSESTAIEAIPFLNKNMDLTYESSIYNLLGIVYTKLYDYDNALYYHNKGLTLNIDDTRKLKIKHNIAIVYMAKEDYNQAIEILLPLTLKKEVINDSILFSKALDNLGYCYFKVGNAKAIAFLTRALTIKTRLKDNLGMASSYINHSKYYSLVNPGLAHTYARLAYEKATRVNTIDYRLESLALLIKSSSGNETKLYSEKYIRINDSITKVRQKARNQFTKIKYDSKKEKEENLALKNYKAENLLELEIQKNRNQVLCFLLIIGILAAIFLYCLLKAINKKEKIQTAYDTETRISKKLHDELANDVYQTMAFAETQDLSSDHNKEQLLNNLDTIYSRTRNISKENSTVDTGIHYLDGLREMISGYNTDAVNILINNIDSVQWKGLATNKKIIIYRVIQELLVNMKKHSHCSLAVFTFKKTESKLQIQYSDNGLGAAIEKMNLKNGLQNVENRILAIKGTITFDTKPEKGFKTSITIPI